ncbi:MAG: hypothetical protein MZV65_38350 [Chromatiales bacterium]|nr:hypothetical protein [Chromatiales bacterium]
MRGSPRKLTLINGLEIADESHRGPDPGCDEIARLATRWWRSRLSLIASYQHDGEFRHSWRHKN